MLHKCANPNCANPFRRLSDGKLFLLETEGNQTPFADQNGFAHSVHRIEHFWLCSQCAAVLTLCFERGRGMVTVPLAEALAKKPSAAIRFRENIDDAAC